MNRSTIGLFASVFAFVLIAQPCRGDVYTISDNSFAGWTFANNSGTTGASAVTVANGGNTGGSTDPYMQATNSGGSSVGSYIGTGNDSLTGVNIEGATYTFTIDVRYDGTSTNGGINKTGQEIRLAVQEGGMVYSGTEQTATTSTSWTTYTFSGTLNSADFTSNVYGSGNTPDFSSGNTLTFGLVWEYNNANGTVIDDYDNYNLSITTLTAVPEPSSIVLIGIAGLAGSAVACKRRKCLEAA